MRNPDLAELPAPPPGKTGWPWTEESERLPNTMPDGSAWPKISIVTPSYGQGQFIEQTIRAILLQGYPNIEYIIIDGGSKDNTVEVIKKYEAFIAYWVSEKDSGQANAINKGFSRATGQLYYWINSDDWPDKNTFRAVIQEFQRLPTAEVLFGNCNFIDENNQIFKVRKGHDFSIGDLVEYSPIEQSSVFFKDTVWKKFGQTKESLHFIMDYELWLRWALKGVNFKYTPYITTFIHWHRESKSANLQHVNQAEKIKLLLDLERSGDIPADLHPRVIKSIEHLCLFNFWNSDRAQFWKIFTQYLKYTRRFPPLHLLVRGLIVLGGKRAVNTTIWLNQSIIKLIRKFRA